MGDEAKKDEVSSTFRALLRSTDPRRKMRSADLLEFRFKLSQSVGIRRSDHIGTVGGGELVGTKARRRKDRSGSSSSSSGRRRRSWTTTDLSLQVCEEGEGHSPTKTKVKRLIWSVVVTSEKEGGGDQREREEERRRRGVDGQTDLPTASFARTE